MQKGICHVSQIPVRGEPRSGAEMVSQLLFGETYSIISEENDWYFIRMDYDGYEGWLSDSSVFLSDGRSSSVQQNIFSAEEHNDLTQGNVISSMGSELSRLNKKEERLHVRDLALKFLGSPYLWGGRHFSGIDCSGFVQIVYKVLAIKLPRDASQQQKEGKPVPFRNLFVGDLVFFEKNEKIGHVGIFLENEKIIHAHGMVRIDTLNKDGIINSDTQKQTHSFHSAKRLR